MWSQVLLVFRKEMLDTLRDRRTIMAMIVVPLLVYPILIIGISQLGLRQVQKIRESKARVTLQPPEAAPALRDAIAADTTFTLVDTVDPEGDLAARTLDAVIELPDDLMARVDTLGEATVTVRVDLSRDRGGQIEGRIREFLGDWRQDILQDRLRERDLPEAFARPFTIETDNAATARQMGGSFIGRFLPFLLVVMMMTGALYPAIDVTAGERERGTLETLLVTPGNRFSIVMGKFLTVFVASMVTTLANLVSMAFTIFTLIGSADLGAGVGENLPSLLDWQAFLFLFLVMIPMALFFCGLAMVVASFARSFKEAQNYLSPLIFACMAPGYLALIPGLEMSFSLALVPVANVVLLSRELFLGNVDWNYFAVTLAVMSGLALLMLNRAVALFGGEGMLGGADTGRRITWRGLLGGDATRTEHLSPSVVVQGFALVILGFFYLGTPLQMENLRVGLVVTQILVIAGIPLAAMRLLRIPIVSSLRLGAPRPISLLAAAVLTPGAMLLASLAASAQGRILEIPDSYTEMMERLFQAQGDIQLLTGLVVFALIPGICEEILFRGFVLRGLLRTMRPGPAILWTGVLFGAFHFDLYRLLPVTILGIVLGWVAWRTGRLWPAILLHVLNNAFAVLVTNLPSLAEVPWLQEGGSIPIPILAGAALLGLLGALGILKGPRAPE